ncbi:MAG: TMEM175 family protein [Solirubrobacteraceae bacterium]
MRSRWDTARTEAFSDGVFAIAITLLVLDIRVPARDFGDLWHGIAHEWPAYLAYVTSFLTIGGIWLGHHGLFGRLRYVDGVVMRINLLLLMAASFLPFPTRLIAEAIRVTDAERAAVIFYGASLLAISLLVAAMWRAVAARPELLRPEIGRPEVDALLRATAPNLGFYVVVLLVAIVAPHVAAFGYLLIAVLLVLRARGDERPAAGAA